MTETVKQLVRLKRGCSICGKPTNEKHLPFCSKRCADIDLSRWLNGVYAIPVTDEDKRLAPPESADQ